MLAIIAYAKDTSDIYSDLIGSVLDDMSSNNSRCEGAPQQQANGAYRMVEMLAVIALESDETGAYSDMVSDVLDDMSSNNSRCNGAPQQVANGLFGGWRWVLGKRYCCSHFGRCGQRVS